MNPLNRRMFRDPRAARRATGILASSAPLMTAAQKAIAQGRPMRAQKGVSVNTSYVPIQPVVNPNFLKPLAARPGDRAPRGGRIRDDSLFPFPYGYGPSEYARTALSDNPASAASINQRVFPPSAVLSPEMQAKINALRDNSGQSAVTAPPVPVIPAAFPPSYDEKAVMDQVVGGLGSDALPPPSPPPAAESDLPKTLPVSKPERSAKEPADADEIFEDAGDQPKEPEKQQVITPDLVQQLDPTAGLSDMERNQRAKPAGESITNKVTNIQSSNLSESKKREKTNEILGIDSLEKEYAVLKEFFGEDRAKDIRTDANYNLMMTGLMIAAGESENAMTNIAKGAAAGLQKYGEAVGEESQDIAAEDKAIKSLVAKTAIERREKQDERTFQELQADRAFGRRVALTGYAADLRGEAAEKAHERAVELQDAQLAASKANVLAQLDSNKQLAQARLDENKRQFGENLKLAQDRLNMDPDKLRVFKALQEDDELYAKYAEIQLLGKTDPLASIFGDLYSDLMSDPLAASQFMKDDDPTQIDREKLMLVAEVLRDTLAGLKTPTTSE